MNNTWYILQVILLAIGVGIAWWQLRRMNIQARADFTYRIYRDLLEWLSRHKECRDWLFFLDSHLGNPDDKNSNFTKWEFDDYLGYFETVWSLAKKGLIDKEIVYDILSDYLIPIYEANNFELRKIIEKIRKEEGKQDFYIGAENLYKEMKRYEKKKGVARSSPHFSEKKQKKSFN